jgi:hypothetical protein
MQWGTLYLLRSGDAEDAFQLLVHLTRPFGGRCRQRIQERGHRGHSLAAPPAPSPRPGLPPVLIGVEANQSTWPPQPPALR